MTRSTSFSKPGALFFSLLVLCLLLAGCGSKTTVVLLPDPDGKVGAVNVSNSAGQVAIETANQATSVSGRQSLPTPPRVMPLQEIEARFSPAMLAQPKPPVHFILYFISDSNQLRPDSIERLPTIFQAIEERNSIDISIVGHTDTVGGEEYNYTLSKQRAEAVAELLIEQGVQASHITTTSHGEENPLVPTGDNVSEPRNRRVEVIVR